MQRPECRLCRTHRLTTCGAHIAVLSDTYAHACLHKEVESHVQRERKCCDNAGEMWVICGAEQSMNPVGVVCRGQEELMGQRGVYDFGR